MCRQYVPAMPSSKVDDVGGLEHVWIFRYSGNNHPNWLIFLRGVETTNQQQGWWCWWFQIDSFHFKKRESDPKAVHFHGGCDHLSAMMPIKKKNIKNKALQIPQMFRWLACLGAILPGWTSSEVMKILPTNRLAIIPLGQLDLRQPSLPIEKTSTFLHLEVDSFGTCRTWDVLMSNLVRQTIRKTLAAHGDSGSSWGANASKTVWIYNMQPGEAVNEEQSYWKTACS